MHLRRHIAPQAPLLLAWVSHVVDMYDVRIPMFGHTTTERLVNSPLSRGGPTVEANY
jgi:hypothetical protein